MIRAFLAFLVLPLQFCYSQTITAIPKGQVQGPFEWRSKIYPGTERNYWVYVPQQYNAAKPACVMVLQDGLSCANGWKLPTVLDSLIALKEMPVTIGIFIDHGKVPAGKDNYPRYNRSVEYDALGDRYARFLLEEILPEVGRSYNLSRDPNDRSIAGASSGAICAFNVAWERPESFRRVISTIGTYVGLRGGDELATLVRKTEPKPLRIFLQDGNHDLNIYAGDWWMANQNMLSALTWAGYEVNHSWGEGGHDSKHTVTILAEALKWLWKDYPAPVQAHKNASQRVNIVKEGSNWTEVSLGDLKADKLAVSKSGELFFTTDKSVYTLDSTQKISEYMKLKGRVGGIAFGSDGTLFIGDLQRKAIVSVAAGKIHDLVADIQADFLTVTRNGVYFTETQNSRIGFYHFAKKFTQYVSVAGDPTGLAVSAEQTFLSVAISNEVFGFSFRILDDGQLDSGQEYVHYHIPYGVAAASAMGMTVDSDNLLYTATAAGLQISDQLGRVNFIFPTANATDVKIGGGDFDTLFLSINGKLMSRKINAKGILPYSAAVKSPKPGL